MDKTIQTWKTLPIKDKLQYITAIVLIFSGIAMGFLSFITIQDIAAGTLVYIGQAFIAGGSIMGVSIYFRDKLQESSEHTINLIKSTIEQMK